MHARGVRRTLNPFQNSRFGEGIEHFDDSPHVVADEFRKLFAGQQGARMPVQKDQQIQIAGIPNERCAGEQPFGVV